jgi:nitronate monooxygenase
MHLTKKMCDLLVEFRPEIVSFHFGLPEKNLLTQVKATGAKVISSATTVDEARCLEAEGCDAIIAQGDAIVAQGYEAGGHRGTFLPTIFPPRRRPWLWCRRWSTP